ncbi:MAG: DsrE family protein [Candidatus Methylomirabilia bacterium]
MAEPPPVLILISEDPRASGRAFEAMRIALGVVAGQNDVTIVLTGPAVHLLDANTDDLVDGDDIAKFRENLKRLDIPFHVETSALPPRGEEWNQENHPVIPISQEELAALVGKAQRAIIF